MPLEYMRFLEMTKRSESFIESMGLFTRRERIALRPVRGKEAVMGFMDRRLRIKKKLDAGDISIRLLASQDEMPDKDGFTMKLDGPEIPVVLASESEEVLQHELQHAFDYLSTGSFILPTAEEGEKRAYLAAFAFMQDGETSDGMFGRVLNAPSDAMGMRWRLGSEDAAIYENALRMVDDVLYRYIEEPFEVIKARAMELLNEEYRKLTGLTYDGILEPFRKRG